MNQQLSPKQRAGSAVVVAGALTAVALSGHSHSTRTEMGPVVADVPVTISEPVPAPVTVSAPDTPSATPARSGGACMEDEPCWNPQSMGNGRGHVHGTGGGASAPSPSEQGAGSSGVVVDDETGGAFDVSGAVAAWGLPGVRMGRCQAGTTGCVTVRLSNLSSAPGTIHEGQTTWRAAGTASVRLSPRTRPADRLHVAVHELGHAFALRHESGTVMEARDDGRFSSPTQSQRARARRNLGR
jgi:hypothetical protein